MSQKKKIYRIWDTITQSYYTLGSHSKKHTWLVFPWEAIRQNQTFFDAFPNRFEVHEFEFTPSKKFNLKKEEI